MMSNPVYVPCGCKAHLDPSDPRAPIWRAALGSLEFPLISPMAHAGCAEGEQPAKFFKGDVRALSSEQLIKLCNAMQTKFGIDRGDFYAQLKCLNYFPIKDQNITVVICQKHSRMMI